MTALVPFPVGCKRKKKVVQLAKQQFHTNQNMKGTGKPSKQLAQTSSELVMTYKFMRRLLRALHS